MSDLTREFVRMLAKRGRRDSIPADVYDESAGTFESPTDAQVDSLNSQTGVLTLTVSGGLLTVASSTGTITLGLTLTASDISTYYEPLTNASSSSPEILFTEDGDVLMAEVS